MIRALIFAAAVWAAVTASDLWDRFFGHDDERKPK